MIDKRFETYYKNPTEENRKKAQGAMSEHFPTPEKDKIITFGPHEGKSIDVVLRKHLNYCLGLRHLAQLFNSYSKKKYRVKKPEWTPGLFSYLHCAEFKYRIYSTYPKWAQESFFRSEKRMLKYNYDRAIEAAEVEIKTIKKDAEVVIKASRRMQSKKYKIALKKFSEERAADYLEQSNKLIDEYAADIQKKVDRIMKKAIKENIHYLDEYNKWLAEDGKASDERLEKYSKMSIKPLGATGNRVKTIKP